jgi:hypothetical protein
MKILKISVLAILILFMVPSKGTVKVWITNLLGEKVHCSLPTVLPGGIINTNPKWLSVFTVDPTKAKEKVQDGTDKSKESEAVTPFFLGETEGWWCVGKLSCWTDDESVEDSELSNVGGYRCYKEQKYVIGKDADGQMILSAKTPTN